MNVLDYDWIFHDSHDLFFRSPFGAVPCGTEITVRLMVSAGKELGAVVLRLWRSESGEEKIKMVLAQEDEGKKVFQAKFTVSACPGWVWYFFIVEVAGRIFYYGNNEKKIGGVGRIRHEEHPPAYQITVYKDDAPLPPEWFQDAVIYQIFVDRFFLGSTGEVLTSKKDCYIHSCWEDKPAYFVHSYSGKIIYDFFGGNLRGVIEKIPYLKELGITAIYFNPIFESSSNHKYDTGDYKKVDPMFGDNDTLKELCLQAAAHGIYVILDGVFSHTGSDSKYFNKEGTYPGAGAYQSKESPYFPWYRFQDYPEKYECWWGVETLPNVNEMEPSYLEFIIDGEDSVLKYWMRKGIKGWRLDVADELPDEFIARFRRVMKETDPCAVLIGEVWEDASNKISYGEMRRYLLGEELDSVMNYPFRRIVLDFILGLKDAEETSLYLLSLYENYPRYHFYTAMNLTGSHDVPRILTLLGEAPEECTLTKPEQAAFCLDPGHKKLALARLKLLSLWQMTFPGVPSVYYGDEAGMEGYSDPLNRGTYPWGREDKEILEWYKRVIHLRRHYRILRTGNWAPVHARGDVYAYVRWIEQGCDIFGRPGENGVAVVLLNRNPHEVRVIDISLDRWSMNEVVDVFCENREISLESGHLRVTLNPLEGKLLIGKKCYEV